MIAAKYLAWLIVFLPLLGGLYLVITKPQQHPRQRLFTALALLGASLASLARYILNGEISCTFLSGPESCFQPGMLSLLVLLLNLLGLLLALLRSDNQPYDYEFYCLLNAAWGGAALANSWVVSLASLSLTLIIISRWVRARGGSVGYFAGRDDYKDDIGPKN
jgi:formate hydrogenlyase subunit 3/multisubunit Na+/H+ antiporter MnhD subunit